MNMTTSPLADFLSLEMFHDSNGVKKSAEELKNHALVAALDVSPDSVVRNGKWRVAM